MLRTINTKVKFMTKDTSYFIPDILKRIKEKMGRTISSLVSKVVIAAKDQRIRTINLEAPVRAWIGDFLLM